MNRSKKTGGGVVNLLADQRQPL